MTHFNFIFSCTNVQTANEIFITKILKISIQFSFNIGSPGLPYRTQTLQLNTKVRFLCFCIRTEEYDFRLDCSLVLRNLLKCIYFIINPQFNKKF